MFLSMSFSLIILFMKHPMSIGACLLSQTIIFSLISGYISMNFWFSYILFLMMISGMLILFLYMTSIASNKKFKISMKMSFLLISTLLMMIALMTMNLNLSMINNMNFIHMNYLNMNFMLTKFFNFPLMIILTMIIIYLLITLIATVKITNINYGPLRQKF
uniref:NADH-ubiquinone oxidoreductase chain 6 n=1 Tax=Sciodrepoides watsoni TaxID=651990 RepID=A0A0S2M8B5_9COLE|nr:NADH dehydrogenase subunit 6 [Sciodrepoides watsoni]ALO70915.1 NADH deshydrogenase subunit 6 [Sciodrepoides watsoni]